MAVPLALDLFPPFFQLPAAPTPPIPRHPCVTLWTMISLSPRNVPHSRLGGRFPISPAQKPHFKTCPEDQQPILFQIFKDSTRRPWLRFFARRGPVARLRPPRNEIEWLPS